MLFFVRFSDGRDVFDSEDEMGGVIENNNELCYRKDSEVDFGCFCLSMTVVAKRTNRSCCYYKLHVEILISCKIIFSIILL